MDVHWAAERGSIAELELVAEYAPDRINDANSGGYTPLHYAADYGGEAAVSFLLSVGANVNQTNDSGESVLSLTYNDRVRQLLIDAGAHCRRTR